MAFYALQRRFAALLRMRSEQGGTSEEVSVGRRKEHPAVMADYAALIRPTSAVGRESEAYPADLVKTKE